MRLSATLNLFRNVGWPAPSSSALPSFALLHPPAPPCLLPPPPPPAPASGALTNRRRPLASRHIRARQSFIFKGDGGHAAQKAKDGGSESRCVGCIEVVRQEKLKV
ncbi:hypothetical protein R5R35_011133 [Gryllus longicercus]|uniref:Uncharacterized protein n=1 Tax=Gryllus longicercus TaxID=2509291 RepID=A0AAN9V4G4_9ORTH